MRIELIVSPYLSENCYILVPDESTEALIVDPGVLTAEPVKERLEELKLEVGAVLCTHGHPDHIWDAAEVAGDKPVFVPKPDLYRFDDPMAGIGRGVSQPKHALRPWKKPSGLTPLGGDILSGAVALIPGVVMRLLPAPGHTEGSSLFLMELANPTGTVGEQIVAVTSADKQAIPLAIGGDVIFKGSVGRTDLPGGDSTQMLHTLRTIQNSVHPHTVVLPGHGPLTTLGDEERTNPFMIQARYQG